MPLPPALPLVANFSKKRSRISLGTTDLLVTRMRSGDSSLSTTVTRVLGGAAILAVLASGLVGGFHVGVEQGWWPSPLPGCQAPRAGLGGSVEDMLRGLSAAPSKPCDAPTYLVPGLPVSMAAMNILYALGLSGLGLILWRRGAKA